MRIISDSSDGYPAEDQLSRLFLVVSHGILIPQILIAWRIRDSAPWILFTILECIVASTAYHMCFSFGICIFSQPLYHRHMDHFCSQLYAITLFTTFLWRRKRFSEIRRAPTPIFTEASDSEEEIADDQGFTIRGWWTKSISENTTQEERLEFYRPWYVDPFIFALHAAKAYVQLRAGLYNFDIVPFFGTAIAIISVAHIAEILLFGLRVRNWSLAIYVSLMFVLYAYLLKDESMGALGHSLSHVIGFSIGWPYMRFGPIFCNADRTHVRLSRIFPTTKNQT